MFWIITSALSAVVLAGLLATLYARQKPDSTSKLSPEMQLLKQQWAVLDTDSLPPEDTLAMRRELSRRILAEDRRTRHDPSPTLAPRRAALAAVFGMGAAIAAAFGLYAHFGAAGYADQPRDLRIEAAAKRLAHLPSQQDAEAQAALPPPKTLPADEQALLQRLRDQLASGEGDITGLTLLAQNEAAIGRYADAAVAQKRLIDLKAIGAISDDYADYADYMMFSASGIISTETRDAIARAIQLDPSNARARYLSGLLMTQVGRGDVAYQIWADLLADPNASSPPTERATMEQALPALKWLSGGGNGLLPQDNPLAPGR